MVFSRLRVPGQGLGNSRRAHYTIRYSQMGQIRRPDGIRRLSKLLSLSCSRGRKDVAEVTKTSGYPNSALRFT